MIAICVTCGYTLYSVKLKIVVMKQRFFYLISLILINVTWQKSAHGCFTVFTVNPPDNGNLRNHTCRLSWRGEVSKLQDLANWGSSVLCAWTISLLHLHDITRICHSQTCLFLSLIFWWHTTLLLIIARWSDSICSHLRLPDKHFGLDEEPPPSTQPC